MNIPNQRGLLAVFAESNQQDDVLKDILAQITQFKAQKDNELSDLKNQIQQAANADSVKALDEKIAANETIVNQLSEQIAALQLHQGAGAPNAAEKAEIEAMTAFMRRGEERAELKKSTNENGGFLVPTEWDRTITNKLQQFSPLREIFRVQATSRPSFERLYNLHGATSGWVGESDTRPNTNTPTFKSLKFETGELYANPSATQQILDDAEIDLGVFLADEVQAEFATQENKAFITGDGTNGKPVGLLTYAEGGANAAKHPLGAIKVVKSGDANTLTADSLLDLVYSLPPEFAQNAVFMMNRKTLAAVRKLKDTTNNYLWQPSLQAGQPSTLMGYPCYEVAEMPDIAANAMPIAFGDMMRAYLILDRKGVSVLRDPYSNKPHVQFYTTKRTGGGVDNPEAIKLLKIAA